MILAIGGKMGVGKDTVARIIQYLVHVDMVEKGAKAFLPSLETYLGNTLKGLNTTGWEIKKFAGKLKQIASILTGIPEYLFESQEFKQTYLSSEWTRYKVSWAFHGQYEGVYGSRKEAEKKLEEIGASPIDYEAAIIVEKYQIRTLLQELGTDAIRNVIHPNAWVNALFVDYKPFDKGKAHDLKDLSELYTHKACINCKKKYKGYKRQYLCKECIENDSIQFHPKWIISDLRFPNEYDAVKKRGGITIRVNRKQFVEYEGQTVEAFNVHPSETALDGHSFDYIIDNDGTIDELVEKVRVILVELKIIG